MKRKSPREWLAEAADRLDRDPAATAARLSALADRVRRLAGPLDAAGQVELCDRLASIERTVRVYRSIEAAINNTRPAIEAAEGLLRAAGRG